MSLFTTYLVKQFASMAEYTQALFGFFIAPLFATVALGMFWKRATAPGRVLGLSGRDARRDGAVFRGALDWLDPRLFTFSPAPSDMAIYVWQATWAFFADVAVTVLVSLVTAPRPDHELAGLVYGASGRPREERYAWYRRPVFWAAVSGTFFLLLNLLFW